MTDVLRIGKKTLTITVTIATIAWAIGLVALVPFMAQAGTITAGDLIKGSTSAVYYYGTDDKRYVFPNDKTYYTWYSDFSTVITISDDDLAAINLGGNVAYRAGTQLVKITTDPKVYTVMPGSELAWIESEDVAVSLYGADWASRVHDVPDVFYGDYKTNGVAMTSATTEDKEAAKISSATYPEGSLVSDGTDTYYINADGGKQNVTSAGMTANLFQTKYVITVSDLSGYTAGTEIAAEDTSLTAVAGGASSTPSTTGALTIGLSSSTPASGSAPYSSSDVIFTKVNFTAGSSDVTITGLKTTRGGLSVDGDLASVKLFDGTLQLGSSQNLNSAHQAVFSNLSVNVPAGTTKTLTLAANIAASGTATSGNSITLSVNSASDITTSAGISGTFPITGNAVTVSAVTIGGATLYTGSLNPTSDTNVDPDAEDFRFSQVKITAGATEGITLTQLTAVKNGTAATSDIKEIKLVNDTSGETLGTASSLNSSGRVVFDGLSVSMGKGESVEFSIKASLNGTGSGRTIGFDFHDGVVWTFKLVGNTYGFGITPTNSTACDGASGGADSDQTTCQLQTISQGALTVNKSSSTPATGYIAQGGSQETIAAFDFVVTGEPVQISSTTLTVSFGTMTYDQFTNVTMYNADGATVAGPVDASSSNTVVYTDTYTLEVGTTTLYVKGNIATGTSANDTVSVGINTPASALTVKGVNSGKTVTSTTASNVTSNTMTVRAAALAVNTAATPVASTTVVNAQDYAFAYFDLDPTSGGEDIKVSAIIVADVLGSGTDYTGAANLELWGDPDTSDSTDADVRLETSNSTATNGATKTFTFKTPLRLSKNKISRLALKADVMATTGTSHTFDASSITATGWSTGNSVSATPTGAGQAQTVVANGLLKVSRASDYPSAAQLVSASTDNSVMKYKFEASYEDVAVTQLNLYANVTTLSDIGKAKIYVDGTQVGVTAGYPFNSSMKAAVSLTDSPISIPKDGYKYVTVKVDMSEKTAVTSGDTLIMGLQDSDGNNSEWSAAGSYTMTATGAQSGASISNINTTGASGGYVYGGNTFTLHKGLLTVSLNASSPGGNASAGTAKEVLRFDLTATGDDVTINEMEFVVSGSRTVNGITAAYLKSTDESTTYATLTAGTTWLNPAAAGFSVGDTSNNVTWTNSVSPVISAGSTLTMKLTGDTTATSAITSGQTLSVAIIAGSSGNNETNSGVDWSDSSTTAVDPASTAAPTKNLPVNGNTLTY